MELWIKFVVPRLIMLVVQSIVPTNVACDHWSHVRCLPSCLTSCSIPQQSSKTQSYDCPTNWKWWKSMLQCCVVLTIKDNQGLPHNMRLHNWSHTDPFILQGSAWAKKYISTNTHKHKWDDGKCQKS